MNKRIFDFESKLREVTPAFSYTFNYMEEHRPTPFRDEEHPDVENYPFEIGITGRYGCPSHLAIVTCEDNNAEDGLLRVEFDSDPLDSSVEIVTEHGLTEDEALAFVLEKWHN